MPENKLISIVLPVYNGEKFLAQSIESCLDQTYSNLELIIVNDCSTDNSLQISRDFAEKDKRVKIVTNDQNKKLPASLNIGHEISKGDLITWTSDDNYFEPQALEILSAELEKTKADIVYCDFKVVKEQGSNIKEIKLNPKSCILFGNKIGVCFLYKIDVYSRNKGYDETLHTVEDYDFWLRASVHSNFHHLKESLYNYRNHEDSLSSKRNDNPTSKKLFSNTLRSSYNRFFMSLEITESNYYSELFTKLHTYEEINIIDFFNKYYIFKKDMELLCNKVDAIEITNLLYDLDIRLRANILKYNNNQNLKVLVSVLRSHPALLLKYDKRNSLQILKSSLSKK